MGERIRSSLLLQSPELRAPRSGQLEGSRISKTRALELRGPADLETSPRPPVRIRSCNHPGSRGARATANSLRLRSRSSRSHPLPTTRPSSTNRLSTSAKFENRLQAPASKAAVSPAPVICTVCAWGTHCDFAFSPSNSALSTQRIGLAHEAGPCPVQPPRIHARTRPAQATASKPAPDLGLLLPRSFFSGPRAPVLAHVPRLSLPARHALPARGTPRRRSSYVAHVRLLPGCGGASLTNRLAVRAPPGARRAPHAARCTHIVSSSPLNAPSPSSLNFLLLPAPWPTHHALAYHHHHHPRNICRTRLRGAAITPSLPHFAKSNR
ncbi:hypothetical protein OH76DRAFT_544559 [Lentinus brumalis]|uniref:Uncharacterized protein n=1 Tax=Lentinus brumalis TaxID=2498619 RepID=A0A371D9Q4_9APHY|nr:hypothetical protein OH76DRAFT_544559 [Polyporus brumalis]